MITKSTGISLGVVVILCTIAMSYSSLNAQSNQNTRDIETLRQKQEQYNTDVTLVRIELGRIGGAMGLKKLEPRAER